MSDWVTITPQQQAEYTKLMNYVNSIIKLKHGNELQERGIKYNVDSLDHYFYNQMLKEANPNILNWLNKSLDELFYIKECYGEITYNIPLN